MSIRELLPLYALGLLDRGEAQQVERAVATDPALRAELAALTDSTSALAESLPPVTPHASVRTRLLESIAAPPRGLIEQLAGLFDIAIDQARAMLTWSAEPQRWRAESPGIDIAEVTAGPAFRGATCGLLRIAAGTSFPWHGHRSEEVALVVSGGARLSDGRRVRPGDRIISAPGTEHGFAADADGPCVFAVRTAPAPREEP